MEPGQRRQPVSRPRRRPWRWSDRLRITVLYVTRDKEEALAISDRVGVMGAGMIDQIGTTKEIYEEPVDRFAAELTGVRNFLPAEVIAFGPEGRVALREAGGEAEVPMAVPPWSGKKVILAVRPEHVELSAQGDDPRGRVALRTYLGASVEYRVQVGRQEVLTPAGPATLLAEGADVILRLKHPLHFWDRRRSLRRAS